MVEPVELTIIASRHAFREIQVIPAHAKAMSATPIIIRLTVNLGRLNRMGEPSHPI
jgi:hypothetical protein